jgi:hypothetical protein
MISYLENERRNIEPISDSKKKENFKLNEVVKEMQNIILQKKSKQYDFDFTNGEKLTAIKKESENFTEVLVKTLESDESMKERKVLQLNYCSVGVNKYKLKLQSLLGNKTLRPSSVVNNNNNLNSN